MYVDTWKPASFMHLLVLSTDSTHLCQIIWSGQPAIWKRCPVICKKNSVCRQSQTRSCRNENPIQWNEFCGLLYVEMTEGILNWIVNEISKMRTSCESVCRANKRVSKWVWWEVGQLSDLLKQRFQNNLLAEFFRFAWKLCRSFHKRKAKKNILSWYLSCPAPFSLLAATGI